jgi:diguanylate cyclase (GGDEF)-like protein/PAS domain S-box-containing protein
MYSFEQLREMLIALKRENEHLRTEAVHATLLLRALESLLNIEREDDPFSAVFTALQTVFDFEQALVLAQGHGERLDCIAAMPSGLVGTSWQAGHFFKRVMDGRVSAMLSNREISEWHFSPPGLSPDQPTLYMPIRVREQRGVLALLRAVGSNGFDRSHVALARKFGLLASHAVAARQASRTEAELSSKRQLEVQNIRFNAALNNMSHALVMFDSAACLTVWNENYLKMYGLKRDRVTPGTTLDSLLRMQTEGGTGPSDYVTYSADVLAALARGKTVERLKKTKDGRTIRVTNQSMADGGWVGIHEDISERKQAEQQIAHMAHHDMLTGLPNRILFYAELDRALDRVQRGGRFAILYLDLDHFKRVNDTLGHLVGDDLLRLAADRLRNCLRADDMIARLGGDEFAILQRSARHQSDPVGLAARIADAMKAPFDLGGHSVVVGASIGISLAPDDGVERDRLLRNADLALYGAKDKGRGTYHFFSPELDDRMKARHKLDGDLRTALTRGEFELYYQPVGDLTTNTLVGCEALLRWNHPERGLLPPAEWIPAAEECGIIIPLGDWVLRQACAEAATWPEDMAVAVNLSPVQFRDENLLASIVSAFAASRLSAHRLELEITEATLMQNNESTLSTLHKLRQLGVRIALDDFGTGYSSLNYLRSFPFDKIKIDRCFIAHLCEDNKSVAIVHAIANLARSLGMVTTAEGVETKMQREAARNLGCTQIQGYLLSRPLPAAELACLLASRRSNAGRIAARRGAASVRAGFPIARSGG